jgi:hypothetical protein
MILCSQSLALGRFRFFAGTVDCSLIRFDCVIVDSERQGQPASIAC